MRSDLFAGGTLLEDRYRIESFLGSGGIATVYDGIDTDTDTRVVVRTPNFQSSNDVSTVQRYFETEREILQALTRSGTHKNVATLLSQGRHEDHAYTVVSHQSGQRLDEILETEGVISDTERLRAIGISLCDTITFAHRAGVLVRDLKPDNVMLAGDRRIKLFDFNAATLQECDEISLSNREHNWGTTVLPGPWRPPEIAHHDSDALNQGQGPWSDVYAIGLLLVYLNNGALPDDTTNITTAELADAPQYLRDVLSKAIDADPERRFGNALAMGLALRSRSIRHVPQAELVLQLSEEVEPVVPGDTVGRINGPGPAPSVGLFDDSMYVSAIHCSIGLDTEQRWILIDHSTNGTLIRRSDGPHSGQWRQVSQPPTPDVSALPARHEDGIVPAVPFTRLTEDDEIALVNPRPAFGTRFRFRG